MQKPVHYELVVQQTRIARRREGLDAIPPELQRYIGATHCKHGKPLPPTLQAATHKPSPRTSLFMACVHDACSLPSDSPPTCSDGCCLPNCALELVRLVASLVIFIWICVMYSMVNVAGILQISCWCVTGRVPCPWWSFSSVIRIRSSPVMVVSTWTCGRGVPWLCKWRCVRLNTP